MNYWNENNNDNIYVAAHRGLSATYPENTLIAFKKAIECGVDQIETDVRSTKDGVLVLIHDETVDRTTNGSGYVKDMTFEELRKLDAGIKKGEEFKGTKIPTLHELMELVKDHPTITLDIELKVYPTDGNEDEAYNVCDRILTMIRQYDFTDRVVINTWSGKLHEYIHKKYGQTFRRHVYYPMSNLGICTENPYTSAFCCCMFHSGNGEIMAQKWEFEEMAKLGVEPWAGAGVKDEKGVDMAIERGATLITCNNADTILAILKQKGRHR